MLQFFKEQTRAGPGSKTSQVILGRSLHRVCLSKGKGRDGWVGGKCKPTPGQAENKRDLAEWFAKRWKMKWPDFLSDPPGTGAASGSAEP